MNLWKKLQSRPDDPPTEQVLARLPERFRSQLLSMYAGEPQKGANGEMIAIDSVTRIGPPQGMYLYDLCRELKPKKTLEIGLAYGFSTIYILAAHHENQSGGSHTAMDPCQASTYHDVGRTQPETVGMAHTFRFFPERSYPTLSELWRQGEGFEFIFIDGNHRFDDILTDFTLSAALCVVGGYISLDDMWMPSIQRAASFIRKNRTDFEEVRTHTWNIAAFKRVAKDTRAWDFHVEF